MENIMYKVVYTKTLDNVDNMVAESWEFEDRDTAILLFNGRVNKLINEILDNEFLKARISINKYKALIKIEDTHHCIAVVDDLNKGI